jgi:hypothetical protein
MRRAEQPYALHVPPPWDEDADDLKVDNIMDLLVTARVHRRLIVRRLDEG